MLSEIRRKLTKQLEIRARNFPNRDAANTNECNKLMLQYYKEILGLGLSWEPNIDLIKKIRKIENNPIFICGAEKSGTTMLLEILDGHNELVVMPGDSHFVNKISGKNQDWQKFWVKRFINPKGQLPFWILGNDTNYFSFAKYLDFFFPKTKIKFLSSVFSFYCANERRGNCPRYWVEKTPTNELSINILLNSFPGGKFLHVIRDPREILTSQRKKILSRKGQWNFDRRIRHLKTCMLKGIENKERLREQYHFIQYENLIQNKEKELKKLASILTIAEEESLNTVTINKLSSVANSMHKNKQIIGKVSEELNYKWPTSLSEVEVKRINSEFSSIYKYFNYEL